MAGIYGPIREHPELREDDPGRFTVTVYRHAYAEDAEHRERHDPPGMRRCWRCGNGPRHAVHAEPWHVEAGGPCPCGQCGGA